MGIEPNYAAELRRLVEERQAVMSACFTTACPGTLAELQAYSERCRVLALGNQLLAELFGQPIGLDRHDRESLAPRQQDSVEELTVEELRKRLNRL